MNWIALLAALADVLCAQGVDARANAREYASHAESKHVVVGAEYMVHSFGVKGQLFVTEDFLTFEVGVFPIDKHTFKLAQGHFKLRINGGKLLLFAQSPGFVAAGLKYADWERRPTMTAEGGAGNGGVILGRPPATERFPGDPRPRQTNGPPPPRAPAPTDRSGVDREPELTPAESAVACALYEGEINLPVAGYLYFPFRGKMKSIRTLELLYEGPDGEITLKLLGS